MVLETKLSGLNSSLENVKDLLKDLVGARKMKGWRLSCLRWRGKIDGGGWFREFRDGDVGFLLVDYSFQALSISHLFFENPVYSS